MSRSSEFPKDMLSLVSDRYCPKCFESASGEFPAISWTMEDGALIGDCGKCGYSGVLSSYLPEHEFLSKVETFERKNGRVQRSNNGFGCLISKKPKRK